MLPELEQYFVHLEGGEHGFDERGGLDRAAGNAELVLRGDEDLVPQPRLEVRLHLRQVEIRPGAARDELPRVVKEVEREIEDRTRGRPAVDEQVLLVEVPAARPHHQHRDLVVELVSLAVLLECDRAARRVAQVRLPLEYVGPRRAVGVLESGHEGRGAAVERVDHHLAVGGTGDLDAAVEQVFRLRRDPPLGLAHLLRLWKEIGKLPGVELLLARGPAREQLLAARTELALKFRNEGERLRGQDLRIFARQASRKGHALRERTGHVHRSILCTQMRRLNMNSISDGSRLDFGWQGRISHCGIQDTGASRWPAPTTC